MRYLITEEQLREMIEFAQKNPRTIFHPESMNDGEPFLSCTFFTEDWENNASGFWELDGKEEIYVVSSNS